MLKKIEYIENLTYDEVNKVALFEDSIFTSAEVKKRIGIPIEMEPGLIKMDKEVFETTFESLIYRKKYMLISISKSGLEIEMKQYATLLAAHSKMETQMYGIMHEHGAITLDDWNEFEYEYTEKGRAILYNATLTEKEAMFQSDKTQEIFTWKIVEIEI